MGTLGLRIFLLHLLCAGGLGSGDNSEPFLLIADNIRDAIFQVNVTSGSKFELPLGEMWIPLSVDYDPTTDYVYWSDRLDGDIKRARRDGSGREIIAADDVFYVYGLALDHEGGNIYWTDSVAKTISVARKDGSLARSLLTAPAVGSPGGLVLDPRNGYMYWTDWGSDPRIDRAEMDGSNQTTIISDLTDPNMITIDYKENRLYYCDGGDYSVYSSDLLGNDILRVFHEDGNVLFGIAIDDDTIYWSSWTHGQISTLPRSNLNQNRTVLVDDLSSPNDIYVFTASSDDVTNGCTLSNGGCHDLCLARPDGRTCACRAFWELHQDGQTCLPPDLVSPSYLWLDHSTANGVTSLKMTPGNSSVIGEMGGGSLPVTVLFTSAEPSRIEAIDYDFQRNLIFWADTGLREIHTVDTRDNKIQSFSTLLEGISSGVEGLAVDWLNQNLYYTDGYFNWIAVVNYKDNSSRHHVIAHEGLERPRGIAVHPHAGYVFWSDWSSSNPRIERAVLSGEQRTVLVNEDIERPSGLVINGNRLFWADTSRDVIESCDLNGDNRELYYTYGFTHFYDITTDGEWITATDWSDNSINFLYEQGNARTFYGDGTVYGVEYFDQSRQPPGQTDCQVNNGGCSHTCVGDPNGHRCLCLSNFHLAVDNHTCIANEHPFSKALLVGSVAGILQLPHNFLELPEVGDWTDSYIVRGTKVFAMDFDYAGKMIFYTQQQNNGTQTIERFSIIGEGSSMTVFENGQGIEGIAVDWVASNLYWTERRLGRIHVSKLDGSLRKVLISNLDQPSAIIAYPEQSYVFWTEVGDNPKITRASPDGSNRLQLVSSQAEQLTGSPTALAIDYNRERLYWATVSPGNVQSCSLNGGDVRTLWSGDSANLFGIAFYKDYALWTDNNTQSLTYGRAYTGGTLLDSRTVTFSTPTYNIKLYDDTEQPLQTSACDQRNGGCVELCLPLGDSRVCACGEGRYTQADEVSCSHIRPTNMPTTPPPTDRYSKEDFLLVADTDTGYITEVNITSGSKVTLPLQSTYPLRLDYDGQTGYVYWSDFYDEKIYRAKRDGSGKQVLIDNNVISLSAINGLAIDYAGQNIYWTDWGTEIIGVARLDGSHARAILSENLDWPNGIVLDPKEGYMYWTDEGFWTPARIERAAMDGSERTVIIDSDLGEPTGIAIDFNERRLYWCDSSMYSIQSSDLDGTNRRTVVTQSDTSFHGLSLHSHDLFWTSTSNSYVGANSKSQSDQTTSRVVAGGFTSLRGIVMYSPDLVTDVSNACSVSNGGCQDICLARPGGRTCACRPYFRLQNDNVTCAPPELKSPSYLWINEVSGKTLLTMMEGNSTIFRSPDVQTLPRTTVMSAGSPSVIVSFDYDIRQGRIFWIDIGLKEIQEVDVNTGEVTTLKSGVSAGAEFLAADWVNQNLYYTDFNYNRITMVSYSPGDSSGNSHIITETGLDKPRGIAVDPSTAFVFWSDWGQSPKIERSTLSGENRTVIMDYNLGRPSGLVIDYVNNRLYFADTALDTISSCHFDGGNRQQFYYLPGTHFYDITFDGEEIMASHWSDATLNFVHNSRNILAFDPPGDNILAVEFFDESRQPQKQSDCRENNGGCQHTCVGDQSGYKCLCLPDYSLVEDQHACVKNGHLFTKALLVSTDEGILQFPHNLADLPATADSKPTVLVRAGRTVAMDFNYNEKAVYYTKEMEDGTQSIQKYDVTTNSSLTIYTGGQGIEGLAVDWVASNIYWTERNNGAINVARLDGSFRKVLLSGLDQPSGIAVQPEQKILYWTETGRISSSTLAGTVKEVIVSSQSDVSVGRPTGIAVDPLNSRIYWTEGDTGTVMSSNLRGNDVEPYWSSNGGELFGMAVYKDFQLWTDRTNRTVSIGLRSTLEKTVQLQTTPHSVRVFDGSEQPPSRGACDQRNGGCADLCLPLGDSRVCACGEGSYIQADGVSCSHIRPTNIPMTTPQTTTPQTDPYSREDFLLVADYDAGYIVEVNITSGSKVTLPLQSTTPTALDYDAETGYVYWSDYYDEMIYRAKRDGSGKEVLIDGNVISVYSINGLALDNAGQNIYWTDSWTEIIGVARLDGSHPRAIVSEDLDYPGGIALDPSEGYMYWTDAAYWTPRIERAAMDGSERTVIIDSDLGEPAGIAIDVNERRLYWCDSWNYIIESSDLDGSNRRTVVSLYSNFYGISLHSHDLFWTSTSDDYIGANTKSDSDQTTRRVLAEEFSSPRGIAMYSPGIVTNVSNACSVSNGGCRDMCLTRPGGRTCACRSYYHLQNDNVTCAPPEIKSPSYLWIAEDDGETLLTMLEGNSSIIRDAQSAPRTTVMSASSQSIIVSFDYDIRQGRIFWIDSGLKEIQQVDIQTGEVTTLKTGISAGAEFLAVDWVNQNLYYTDFNYNRITMVSYSSGDSNGKSHIITETGLDKPRGIAVDPSAALLFWSDWGQSPKIERSTLSGEDRTVIVDSDLGHPSGLVIDYVNSKLYFADTELDAIYSCDFDGGNREKFYTLERTHFYDITFDGEEIMASDWSDSSINFIHDTRNLIYMSGGGKVLAVEFYDESRQLLSQSDCQENNGGCQHTCVGDVSGHRCLCLPDYSLAEDQHACVKNDHLFTKALLVSTDEGILQFPHNLADLPATADSKPAVLVRGGRTVAMDFNYNEKAIYYTKEMGDGTQSIQKYELTTNTSMTIYTGGQGIEGLAVDWVASNIYWTEMNNGTINVARLDGSFRKVLLSGLLQPRGVAVHPEQKVLYWTETGRISRSTLAGTNKSVVVSSQSDVSISNPAGIAIDLPNSWIYWTDRGTVMSSNLRGEDAEPYWTSNGGELFGIAVYKDFQFWTDRTNRTVSIGLRGTLEKTVHLQTTPHSVRVFDGSEQPFSRGPCDLRNGGCNELCLPITADDRVCACAEGHLMQADNLTCFNPAPTTPPTTTAVQTTTVTPAQPATTQAAPRTTYTPVTACTTDTLPSVTNGEFGQCVVITGVKTCPVVCRPTYGPTVSNIKCLPNGNWNTSTGFTCTKLTTPQAISVPVSFSIPTAPCTSDTSALTSARSSLIRNFQNNGICRTASQNNVELCNPDQMTVSCSVVSGRNKRAPDTEVKTEENHYLKKRNIISYLSHEKTLKKQAKEEMVMFRDANRKKRNPILHIKNKQVNNDDVLLQVVKKAVADGAIFVNRVKRNGNGLDVDIEVKATPDTSGGNVEDNISKAQAKVQGVVDDIRAEVTSGNVAVEMDGRTYTADPGSFTAMAVKYDCPVGTMQIDGGCGEAPSSGGSNGTAVAVGVIVALLLLGAISLGGYMYCRQQRRKFGPAQNVRLSDLTARDNPVYDASDIPPAYTEYQTESFNAYAMAGLPEKAGPDGAMEAAALPEKAPPPQWVTFDDGSNMFREPAEQNVYETIPSAPPPVEYNMFVDNPSNEKGGETNA
ncbi:low-density lipoprotein receptor-related protein 2-like isoform X2 [Branchiostoma floridae x Branchiostoma japonicum]